MESHVRLSVINKQPSGAATAVAQRLRRQVLPFLPPLVAEPLSQMPDAVLGTLEEVRLRVGRPPQALIDGKEYWITPDGRLGATGLTTAASVRDSTVSLQPAAIARCLALMTASSVFAVEDELRQGFLTLPGGHRVGVAGRVVPNPDGTVKTLKDIAYLNVRVAREVLGSACPAARRICDPSSETVFSTIVLSPPGAGKTTLLRDLARILSEGWREVGLRPARVAVVDERMELAGFWHGVPQFDLGPRTDVLTGSSKAEGLGMLIRAMSPEIVVTDELGSPEDAGSILDAGRAGVRVLASAHAADLEELRTRPQLRAAIRTGVFRRAIILSRRHGPGTIESITDLATGKDV